MPSPHCSDMRQVHQHRPHTAVLACKPAACVQGGCGDITTRANIQLRGVTLAEADQIIEGLVAHGLSSVMSGMDNVRNITGSPISGIDPHELINVRQLTHGAWPYGCPGLNDAISSS